MRHGLSVDPPSGWDVQIFRREPDGDGSSTSPVVHAATIPLPSRRGDFGTGAVELLGAHDALVSLVEFEPEAVHTPLFSRRGFPRPRASEFHPQQLQRTLPGQSGCQWFFGENGRAFCLYVVLGSHAQRVRVLPRVHALLDGIAVGRRRG